MRRFAPLPFLVALASLVRAQTFRESVDVGLVRVEILALDGKGQPVLGLKPSDLTVRVDSRPIKVESFEEARAAVAPIKANTETSKPGPAPADTAAQTAPPAAPGRFFLAILVDETSSEQSNRQSTLGEVFRFLETSLPPGVEVLLMRFDGALHVECPWTSETERLRKAATAMTQHRFASRLDPPGSPRDPGLGTTKIDLDAMERLGHIRASLAGLFDALRLFPEKPGRKGLFFVSDGEPFLAPSEVVKDLIVTSPTLYTETEALENPRHKNEAQYDRDLLVDGLAWDRTRSASLLMDISRLALVRGIEINPVRSAPHDYGVNVRTDRPNAATSKVTGGRASPDANSLRGGNSAPTSDLAVGASMTAVAETTGGEAVLSRRSLEGGLKQEVARSNNGYALTFRDPFAGDHRFHRIEISSAKSGLSLRYRRGYRILDVRESLIQSTLNRLQAPADENALGVRLDIESLGMRDDRALVEITVSYPSPPEAGGKTNSGGAVQIIGTSAVKDGKVSEPIDMSGETRPASVGGEAWLTRVVRLNLEPGDYRLSFAIRDEQTGITSYLTFDRKLP